MWHDQRVKHLKFSTSIPLLKFYGSSSKAGKEETLWKLCNLV
jgi:hypothetical protein